ncbi:MAG: YlxR family protein [Eubacteriales bacterium]|nr:YlxR family protein [Eubacteriales bacterium]MDD3349564.1 YlxR family protein [Eubacteriales bacterium]
MKTKKIPMRRCVGCMESKPKKELIRVTAGESGEIAIDPTGKANGRGVYLCPNLDCFATAKKRKALSRGLEVEITEQQYDRLYQELTQYAAKNS